MSLLLLLDHLATTYSRGTYSTLPVNNNDLSTVYSRAEYSTVLADDSSYVAFTGESYIVNQFKYQVQTNTQAITVTWNGNTANAPSNKPVFLQIYNYNLGTWETLASNNTAAASTDFTLTGNKTSNVSQYYDLNQTVAARVYQ